MTEQPRQATALREVWLGMPRDLWVHLVVLFVLLNRCKFCGLCVGDDQIVSRKFCVCLSWFPALSAVMLHIYTQYS